MGGAERRPRWVPFPCTSANFLSVAHSLILSTLDAAIKALSNLYPLGAYEGESKFLFLIKQGKWESGTKKYSLSPPLHFLPKPFPHATPPISSSKKAPTHSPDICDSPNSPPAQTVRKSAPNLLSSSQFPYLQPKYPPKPQPLVSEKVNLFGAPPGSANDSHRAIANEPKAQLHIHPGGRKGIYWEL